MKHLYVCTECGDETSVWEGQCRSCGMWGTYTEVNVSSRGAKSGKRTDSKVVVAYVGEKVEGYKRTSTGDSQFDDVLGGGLVPGSVVLLAGEPGIGKSTLLTQITSKIEGGVVYVSAEESVSQVLGRFERVVGQELLNVSIVETTDVDDAINECLKVKPNVVIVDSVQALGGRNMTGLVGGVSQIRNVTSALIRFAKENGIVVVLTGHITKDGVVAGPKVLEHMVDVVLVLEGERQTEYRVLRSLKNRYGTTGVIAIYTMEGGGLVDASSSGIGGVERERFTRDGVAYSIAIEGDRPIVVEIEALVSKTQFSMPKRVVRGVKSERLHIMMGVLSKYNKLDFASMDVYLSVSGGIKVADPALDLAICLALVSSVKREAVSSSVAVIGEVGLDGMLKPGRFVDRKIKEAKRFGFSRIWIPKKIDIKGISTISNTTGLDSILDYRT